MDLLKKVTEQLLDEGTLSKLGGSVGARPEQVKKATQMGLPALMEAMGRNAKDPDGLSSLLGALDQHQDDDVLDLDSFLNKVDKDDGAKILSHVLGGNSQRVQTNLARQSGMDPGQVSGILTQLAPMLLGALGQEKKRGNLDASNLIGMLAGGLGQGGNGGLKAMVTNLLDADDDGSIIDEVGDLLGGFLKR